MLPDEGGSFAVTPEIFCLGLYLLGAVLIAGVMAWQVFRIHRLRRGAEISRTGDYTLVRTRQEIASFSFLRTIYVWDKTPAGELAAILAHESSHIAHRHSIERILMELMKALLWWNPFAWIAARRLTEAEEFEADNDVLSSGYDRAEYMQTIFRQLFGYSPEIANGLRNSLTKKRFKMMTKQTKSRHGLLAAGGYVARRDRIVVRIRLHLARSCDRRPGDRPRNRNDRRAGRHTNRGRRDAEAGQDLHGDAIGSG